MKKPTKRKSNSSPTPSSSSASAQGKTKKLCVSMKVIRLNKKKMYVSKGKVEIENGGKVTIFFFLSHFKTTEICFESTKMGIFYREKAFHAGKKI